MSRDDGALTTSTTLGHHPLRMLCPKCAAPNALDATRCSGCGDPLSVAVLEVIRGDVAEKIRFLRPRPYSLGRARHNDIALNEPSISKVHAKIDHQDGRFFIEDAGSLHGVYVNAAKVRRAELAPGAQVQLGNVTLKFSLLGADSSTGAMAKLPWVEQQQLLLSLVQTLNSTLVLSQVLEQVLDAIMHITGAERGFLLLADSSPPASRYPSVAGLRLRVARGRVEGTAVNGHGISAAIVRRALDTGEVVSTVRSRADGGEGLSPPGRTEDDTTPLQTVVCLPLRSPRSGADGTGAFPRALGVLYVDNAGSADPFSGDALRAAEALARHATLAIENAQLFEREQHTIEELQKAQKQLLQSEKLATIGQMAAGIAHELNTPLTYIMGNLELLELQDISPSQREMVSSIARGADRIRSLARRLLAFSRPAREEMAPLAVNDVVERSLELCQYQIASGRVALVKSLEADLPRVLGVSNQLELALINLVVNAVHAMGEKGGTLRVATCRQGDDVEVSVSDEGPGIPERIRGNLFEPFVTTKPEGKGTGLGLSTVLMVVERHNGRVDFDTGEERGTTFRITLPPAPQ
ncbi:MAG TPA: ATP-binding protein [Vicinamibacteria bacterium]|nr:ATP-binding protein [Vicinamibacteria bacterium]